MNLERFTPDVAQEIINLWQEHLGNWFSRDVYSAEALSRRVQAESSWIPVAGSNGKVQTFRPKVGSRYSHDTRLSCTLIDGRLEVACKHPVEQYIEPKKRIGARTAQEAFDAGVKEYFCALI